MTDNTEWLTVAEAARRLGLSDRHARRLVDRLDDADRLKQATGPLRVRLAALAQLWEREGGESDSRTPLRSESETESDSPTPSAVEAAVSRARLEERLEAAETLITELRQDKRQLQEAMQREQENHMRLLDQLAEERQELRLLQSRIIGLLPAPTERESDSVILRHPAPPMEEVPEPPAAQATEPTPPVTAPPPPIPEPRPMGLWQRLARWVSD